MPAYSTGSLLSRSESWNAFLAGLKALGNSESANKEKRDTFEVFDMRFQSDKF